MLSKLWIGETTGLIFLSTIFHKRNFTFVSSLLNLIVPITKLEVRSLNRDAEVLLYGDISEKGV